MIENFWNMPLLADWATDTLHGLEPGNKFALLVVGIACGTGVLCTLIAVISSTIDSIHRRRSEAAMKREMLDRGMSDDEIAKVISSTAPSEFVAQR